MSDPPEAGCSSTHPTSDNAESTSSGSSRRVSVGFYDRFRTGSSSKTPMRPSFLEDSTTKLDGVSEIVNKQNDFSPGTVLTSNSTSILSSSTFGSLKRKRKADIIDKPSFKVSEFIAPPPHLPKFGTSLTKAKFDFTSSSNRSMFYSGRTKFGGSSSIREDSAKRIKISPVSKSVRTNVTRVSAKPYSSENKRTLTSKTAENILKTLNKICSPVKQPEKQPFYSEFTSSFSSFSKRLRDKRKTGMSSLPQPPIERLNLIKSIQVSNRKVNSNITNKETESVKSSISDSEILPENEDAEVPTIKSTEHNNIHKTDVVQTAVSKNGLKMKRQRTGAHYTASEKTEQPVNTMPEVTAVQPMIISALPKFDLSVKPSSAPIFTPIMKLPKPVNCLKSITDTGSSDRFIFSTPTTVSNKNIDAQLLDVKYSFISPVPVKNPETPKIPSKKVTKLTKHISIQPVKEISNKESKSVCDEENVVFSSADTGGQPPIVEELKDTVEIQKSKSVTLPVSTGFKFAKPEEGSWECPTCMITNKPDCFKCAACTEPKPGSNNITESINSPFSFGQTTVTMTKSEFSFGKTSVAPSTFSFASTNVAASTGFTFSKPFTTICSSGFSFGKTTDVTSSISSESKLQSAKTESMASTFSFSQPSDNTSKSEVKFGKLPDVMNSFGTNNSTTGLIFGKPIAEVSGKPSNTEGKPHPFEKLKPAVEGSWDCPTCMITNKPDCQKCAACTEPKPGGNKDMKSEAFVPPVDISKSEFKFGSAANSTSGMFSFGTATNQTAPGGLTFGTPGNNVNSSGFSFGKSSENPSVPNPFEKLKPAAGSWDCPTCMIVNALESLKCIACTEPKPGEVEVSKNIPPQQLAEQPVSKSEFTFGSSTSNSFTFGASSKQSEGFSFKNAAAAANPFFNIKQPEEGSWDCPTCMINNKPDSLKCAACTEPKPGSNPSVASSISYSQPTETKSEFSFGKPSNDSNGSSGFSFVPPPANSVSSSGSSGFSFVPSVPSVPSVSSTGFGDIGSSEFSFGKLSSNTSGFTFGKTSNGTGNSNSNHGAFSFGGGSQNTKDNEVKMTSNMFANQNTADDQKILNGPTAEVKTAPSGFNFGAVNNNENPMAALSSSNSINTNMFTSVPSFDSTKFNGISAAPVSNALQFTTVPVSNTPQFNFSSSAPSFMFNSNDNKPSEPPPKFNFNPGAMSTSNFNFGTATNAAAVFGNPNPSGQFSFVNNNNVADSNKNEAPKLNMFAQAPASTNLFTIGGGSANTLQRNSGPERRKVKRAHRKLPGRK